MDTPQTIDLYVTYVEKEGPFLKVWGQPDKRNAIYVEQFLLGASPQFDLGIDNVLLDGLQAGTLVCAKYKDDKYYRARITSVAFTHEGFVEVSFVDYGNKDVVPTANVRSLQNFPSSFISLPSLATGFIFAEAHSPGGAEWNDVVFDNISKEIRYREVQCALLTQATQYYLVKLFVNGSDLAGILISRGLMQPISLQAQQAVLLSMSMQKQNAPPTLPAPANTGINTYKACTLEPGSQYPVYVSYVNDGPCHFSVQLKQSEDVMAMLMSDINTIALRLLEDVPIPGTICLAKCQEDGNICRAVVTNEVDNQFKVFYVDFGNYEVVPVDALYQIPFKYVVPKVMAIRCSLAGVEKSTETLEMQLAFKRFVDNRLLHIKVLPSQGRAVLPKCELWDPESKTSVLDVVLRAARNAYPEPICLNRGTTQLVKVSYAHSCNRFYVQLVSKENELLDLMLDLQDSCRTNEAMDPSGIKPDLPCSALFSADEQWYRSQIVEVLGDEVKVRYIDYGNEEVVPVSQLKVIEGEQLTVLRPQAIECCLNGYQNMEEDLERDGFLEELILEGQFTMKVVEMTGKKALVELFDISNYNIASLLLEKLAAAKSQVSPLLVQAGNKIEHRKPYQNDAKQDYRQDRKPGRENRGWNDKPNDRNDKPWRQENKEFRNYDKNDASKEGTSWRQNNKGFSPNNERYSKRETRSGNGDWQNKENVVNTDDWDAAPNASVNNGDDFHNNRRNDFNRNKSRAFDKDNRGNWNNGGGPKGGFGKNDFRKDGSELSSSGSEKSFQKGMRTSSRNDRGQYAKKRFDKPTNGSFDSSGGVDSWNVSTITAPMDAAPATASFVSYDVAGSEHKVIISWFHNPSHFYCQLQNARPQFRTLMEDIRLFYKNRKPESAPVAAPVVALFPEDNVLYRAQVLENAGGRHKVYYVDFGNVSTVMKVWPIEKKFMTLPAQALVCGLNNVRAPGGDSWPVSDDYADCFDKEFFTCRFVDKDEKKYLVNLSSEAGDVSQRLFESNLAVPIASASVPDIEIPMLVGQQFRAIVKSVNNLSDIIIALECGLALGCRMHNLETATETDEPTLKTLLEQTVIVYVDDLIDDKLDVTVYDLEGFKLNIVVPDEGAFESVEILCPLLVTRSILTGFVSHVDGSSIYLQPVESAELLGVLLEDLFEFYDKQKEDLPVIVPEEGLLYAVCSEDTNWYRGQVVAFDDEKTTVFYVDYGNSEKVAFGQLRELEERFLTVNILALRINLDGPADHLVEKDVTVKVGLDDSGWFGAVQNVDGAEHSETESASQVVEEVAKEDDLTRNLEKTRENIGSETESTAAVLGEKPLQGIQITMSHIDSPNEFYIHLSEAVDAIAEFQSGLQERVPEMITVENPAAGVLCAAPFSADQQWYRAEVLDADADITTVRFIDYGNTDVIDNKSTSIKTLPADLLSLAVFATRCSLNAKPLEEEWSAAAIERFEFLTDSDNLTAEFVGQDEKTNYVELYCDGNGVKDVLIAEKLAEVWVSESKQTCFVSHLNSPSEFWIQLENCVEELEWIAERLSAAESFSELEDLAPGTLCAALFPDDELWYRARILSNTVAGLELLFIDYGNSCTSASLRQLPEDLVVTAPLAQKCALQRPEELPCWTPQAAERFSELSADGQTIFSIRKLTTGETSIVQLLLDGEDVALKLLPRIEDGSLTEVESVDNFKIVKNGEVSEAVYGLEPVSGTSWMEDSGDKLKEVAEQGSLFQIEYLTNNKVRLYLDGIDIRPQLGVQRLSLTNLKVDTDKSRDSDDTLVDSETTLTVQENQTVLENTEFLDEEDTKNKSVELDKDIEEEKITTDEELHEENNDKIVSKDRTRLGNELNNLENKDSGSLEENKDTLEEDKETEKDERQLEDNISFGNNSETEEFPVKDDYQKMILVSPTIELSKDTVNSSLSVEDQETKEPQLNNDLENVRLENNASLNKLENEESLEINIEKESEFDEQLTPTELSKEAENFNLETEKDDKKMDIIESFTEVKESQKAESKNEFKSDINTDAKETEIKTKGSYSDIDNKEKLSESRPTSRCSGKISHIRPQSPLNKVEDFGNDVVEKGLGAEEINEILADLVDKVLESKGSEVVVDLKASDGDKKEC